MGLGTSNLLVVAALFLEAAILCARKLEINESRPATQPLGGGWLAGISLLVRSPYRGAQSIVWAAALLLARLFHRHQQKIA